jgi:hypothetical protein
LAADPKKQRRIDHHEYSSKELKGNTVYDIDSRLFHLEYARQPVRDKLSMALATTTERSTNAH